MASSLFMFLWVSILLRSIPLSQWFSWHHMRYWYPYCLLPYTKFLLLPMGIHFMWSQNRFPNAWIAVGIAGEILKFLYIFFSLIKVVILLSTK